MNRCRTCKFFESHKTHDEIPETGDCRRYPPTPLPATDWHEWAVVAVEDWCGEHRQLAFPRDDEVRAE